MKILVLTSSFPAGSEHNVGRFVLDLAQGVRERIDGRIVVLAPQKPGAPAHYTVGDIEVYRYRYDPFNHGRLSAGALVPTLKDTPIYWALVPFYVLNGLYAALKLARKYDVDIVHSHWLLPQALTGTFVKLMRGNVKHVVTLHGAGVRLAKRFPLSMGKRIARFVWNNVDVIIAVSAHIKSEFLTLLDWDDKGA